MCKRCYRISFFLYKIVCVQFIESFYSHSHTVNFTFNTTLVSMYSWDWLWVQSTCVLVFPSLPEIFSGKHLVFFLFLSPWSNFHSIGSPSFILKLGVKGISISEDGASILLSCSPSFWLTSERCHFRAFYTPTLKSQFHV